jgi:hypothetical protein
MLQDQAVRDWAQFAQLMPHSYRRRLLRVQLRAISTKIEVDEFFRQD